MKFEIVGKNVSITEGMRGKIEKKLSSLNKYILIDENAVARVVARVYPNSQKIEVTIPSKAGLLRTEVVHEDLYAAIDIAVDKLEDQIRKQKTRLSRKHKEKLALSFLDEELTDRSNEEDKDDVLVKTKTIKAEKMDIEEAILRMNMLNHSFFIYTDEETDTVSVVYKRHDGGYGLIETE